MNFKKSVICILVIVVFMFSLVVSGGDKFIFDDVSSDVIEPDVGGEVLDVELVMKQLDLSGKKIRVLKDELSSIEDEIVNYQENIEGLLAEQIRVDTELKKNFAGMDGLGKRISDLESNYPLEELTREIVIPKKYVEKEGVVVSDDGKFIDFSGLFYSFLAILFAGFLVMIFVFGGDRDEEKMGSVRYLD